MTSWKTHKVIDQNIKHFKEIKKKKILSNLVNKAQGSKGQVHICPVILMQQAGCIAVGISSVVP